MTSVGEKITRLMYLILDKMYFCVLFHEPTVKVVCLMVFLLWDEMYVSPQESTIVSLQNGSNFDLTNSAVVPLYKVNADSMSLQGCIYDSVSGLIPPFYSKFKVY